MGDNQKGFWSNLPAVLGGISGLIMAIVALINVLQSPGSSIKPAEKPKFQISADSKSNIRIVKLEPNIRSVKSIQSPAVKFSINTRLKTIHQGDEYWAKEGYYLNADNQIRIWPSEIDGASSKIKVTDNMNRIILEKTLKVSEAVVFNYNNTKYKIGLDKTGRAGRNPFTKAAFFIVKKA